jgi:hypothetical protein
VRPGHSAGVRLFYRFIYSNRKHHFQAWQQDHIIITISTTQCHGVMVVMVVRGLRDLCSGVVVVMVLLSRESILDIF